jgi:ribonuclease BN (tRNA processing enzyme)
VRVALLGVRGSTPAPGPAFVRYGGHTSCVAVLPDGPGPPALVLDAGTGVRDLPGLLGPPGTPFDGDLVLTHLHWDHVQGLPFCPSLDHPRSRVAVHVPTPPGAEPVALLARGMSPPYFPIGPEGLLGDWSFHASTGFTAGGLRVSVAPIGHRGLTHGVRVEDEAGAVLAYLPDHSPRTASAEEASAAEKLAAGADVLLHDAQFSADQRSIADTYGHSTIDDAQEFAHRCDAGRLVLTHHAPTRTDAELDGLSDSLRSVVVAVQGAVIRVR